MNENRLTGIALVLAAALLIAGTGVLVKEALARGGEPETLIALRYAVTGALLGVPLLIAGVLPRSRRALMLALAIGITMWLAGSFEFEALSRLPLSVVIVIVFISPLWVALHSRIFRREQLGWQRHLAFVTVLAGIVLLVGPALGRYDVAGLAYALGASLVWAAMMMLVDEGKNVSEFSPLNAIAYGALVAGVVSLIIQPTAIQTELGEAARVPYVLGVGITTGLAFGLLAIGMRAQHVFDVIVVAASEPLFAVLFGTIFLGENLGAAQLLGVLLVALGVVTIARTTLEEPRPPIVV